MNRFFRWCRRPYVRIYFAEPKIHRLAEDALKAVRDAQDTTRQAINLYTSASRDLSRVRDELQAYLWACMEPDAQIADLKHMAGEGREEA